MLQLRLKLFVEAGGSLVGLVSETKIPMPAVKALEYGDASLLNEADIAALDKILPAVPAAQAAPPADAANNAGEIQNDAELPTDAAAAAAVANPAAQAKIEGGAPKNAVRARTGASPHDAPARTAAGGAGASHNPFIPTKGQMMKVVARRLFARDWSNKNLKFIWTHNDTQLQIVLKTGLMASGQGGKEERFTIRENARIEVWELMSGRRIKDWTAEFAWNAPAEKVLAEIAATIDEFCPLIVFRPKCARCHGKAKKHLALGIVQHDEEAQRWVCGECGFWEKLNGGTTKSKSERKMKELQAAATTGGKAPKTAATGAPPPTAAAAAMSPAPTERTVAAA